jgi:hypothetical protein
MEFEFCNSTANKANRLCSNERCANRANWVLEVRLGPDEGRHAEPLGSNGGNGRQGFYSWACDDHRARFVTLSKDDQNARQP